MNALYASAIQSALHARIAHTARLHGGSIGEVFRVRMEDGRTIVAKVGASGSDRLDLEGAMLIYLREHSSLPVPQVLHSDPTLLLLSFIPGDSRMTAPVQDHAAQLLADLHAVRTRKFGLEFDTLIGGLHQPNVQRETWLDFFRDQRLLYMAAEAQRGGMLPNGLRDRIETLAGRLDRWLQEPAHPSLLHGDMWTTNILAQEGKVTGFIDPAIYYGHPEIELAFSTLFGTFGDPFFRRYGELRPIAPGFFEERRDLYNLYPLLVHVRLFGGGYVGSVESIVRRFGC